MFNFCTIQKSYEKMFVKRKIRKIREITCTRLVGFFFFSYFPKERSQIEITFQDVKTRAYESYTELEQLMRGSRGGSWGLETLLAKILRPAAYFFFSESAHVLNAFHLSFKQDPSQFSLHRYTLSSFWLNFPIKYIAKISRKR